ncbi:hypothetical protein GC207_09670 [bacterium]|nr:hypothetical protein [bacterium]
MRMGGGGGPGGPAGDRGPGRDGGPGAGPGRDNSKSAITGPPPGIAEALRQTGLTAVCATFKVDFVRGDPMEAFVRWLDTVDAALAADKLSRALKLTDLERARDQAKPTIVQGTEGGHFIAGELGRLEKVYARGLRQMQMFHDRDDTVKSMGDFIGNRGATGGGLTAFGADVVRECLRLGILVDLAHGTFKTVMDGAKIVNQPFVVSHVAPSGGPPMMRERTLEKEQARAIADAGGVIGVWTKGQLTPAQYVQQLQAMIEMAGVDHVGIGTDTDLLSTRSGQSTATALHDAPGGFFPAIVAEMLRQGFSSEDILKVGGGNYCRAFDAATRGH